QPRRRRRPGPLHGMGRRQAGGDYAARHGQAPAARLDVRVGHPLLRCRRRDHQQRRARDLLLSERRGAKVPPGPAPDGHGRHRHSAEHDQADRRLLRDEAERARRELPAAHAPARQGDADGSHPAERAAPDPQPRRQLQLQLAQQLLLRRRCGAAPGERDRAPHHRVARQHDGQQIEPGSDAVGRLRRPHRRRDGACVGERHVHERRRLQGGGRETQGEDAVSNHERPAAAVSARNTRNPQTHETHEEESLSWVSWFRVFRGAAVATVIAASVMLSAQQQLPMLPLGPNKDAGDAVTGAFEGWFYKADGSISFLVGYFNRNLKQVLDIPIGPNNHIDPGGPDYGQPTHFLTRRQWGVFTIPVPKDFGDKKLTWTIVANGQTTTIPLSVHQNYQVEPYEE